jgi:hypothetical protein
MTEEQWLSTRNPGWMVQFVSESGQGHERRLRLFACACVRRIWHLVLDERSRAAVNAAELYAEGDIEEGRLEVAQWAAEKALRGSVVVRHAATLVAAGVGENGARIAVQQAARAAYGVTMPAIQGTGYARNVVRNTAGAVWRASPKWAAPHNVEEEHRVQANLLREYVGPLAFRSVTLYPDQLAWGGGSVPAMAMTIHEEGAFHLMPVVGDALEEAGCTDAHVLTHCRQPGEHVRGCWVVDLILGKS